MRGNGCGKIVFETFVAACVLLAAAGVCRGQQPANDGQPSGSASHATTAMESLADSLRELQQQVLELNAEVKELRDEQKGAQAEARALRGALADAMQKLAPQSYAASPQPDSAQQVASQAQAGKADSLPPGTPYSTSRSFDNLTATAPGQTPAAAETTIEDRLSRLQESQEVTAANVRELSQTKVESGSKYRLRLSGIVLLNMFENRGTVDNLDIPEVALPRPPINSSGAFGGTLRQSQIELEGFGPDIAGAHVSANLTFDFAGGLIATQNGATKPLVRLRTGTIRMDWTNTSVIAGQDALFFVPLSPSSLATLAVPALSYAGDLWNWSPQIRVEHRIHLSDTGHLLVQGGILDSLSGDVAVAGYERNPSWGERSGLPALAGRVAWSHQVYGQDFTLGGGGYYAHQYWGFDRTVEAWAGTVDMDLPLGKLFDFSAAFYRGRSVGGLGGGVGQSILTNGSFGNSATAIRGLDTLGGWGQLKLKLRTNFEVNGALGVDNPFADELREFPGSPSYYGLLISRNLSPLVNFIYQPRSDVVVSAEYRHLQTHTVNSAGQKASVVNLSLGYTF